jgi:hypothetical protein
MPQDHLIAPPLPQSVEQTGLPESVIEQLLLKILYFRGDLYGQDLSSAIALPFSVIQDLLEGLKLRHHVQVKRSLGMGNVGALFSLTEDGRGRARDHLESNQYSGPAPVPLAQYQEIVRGQRPGEGWLTKEGLAKAFRGLVLSQHVFSRIGPAISSANSFLLYGKPGDGKTSLIESLANLDTDPIFLPYAIECQGNIVQVYDPIYHQMVDEQEPAPGVFAVAEVHPYDRRWAKCKRPFIVSGGELSLDMLDLRYNSASKVYEAPFQLKANNGIYLVDDFGRQRATPAEVLNRWIVPMERRVDYLNFLTGGKMTVPFETFLVFSTNLNPADLGDEAFLRRIQYKMLLRGPGQDEFISIFENFCAKRQIPCSRDLILRFIERRFKPGGKLFRRCQPRDVLTHALNLIHFEKLPWELTDEILDRAFESCFVQEEEQGSVAPSPLMPQTTPSCSDYWDKRVERVTSAFGALSYLGLLRDCTTGEYLDEDSAREYGKAETAGVLHRFHTRAFAAWLRLSEEEQRRDLAQHLAHTRVSPSQLYFQRRELIHHLVPGGARSEEVEQFGRGLKALLESLCGETGEPGGVIELRAPVEKIA